MKELTTNMSFAKFLEAFLGFLQEDISNKEIMRSKNNITKNNEFLLLFFLERYKVRLTKYTRF